VKLLHSKALDRY